MADDRLPLLTFPDAASLDRWLDKQGQRHRAPGSASRNTAPEETMSKSEAIDCALAHGWVDGQLNRIDKHYFKTRFTLRRAESIWSQINRERGEHL